MVIEADKRKFIKFIKKFCIKPIFVSVYLKNKKRDNNILM